MIDTVHVIAPFHSRLVKEKWSHCAFTQITLKQIEIFRRLGLRVIDYSNWGSESSAHEHVELLGQEAFAEHFADDGLPGHNVEIGSAGWEAWWKRLVATIVPRVEDATHLVVHTFGDAASRLTAAIPNVLHLESHVGYNRAPFGAYRVYVSNAWRSFLWGKYGSTGKDHRYSWVVLPYYDVDDWPVRAEQGEYIAFMGRVTPDKGVSTVIEVARRMPDRLFKIAGSGSFDGYDPPANVEYLGVLPGGDRAAFLGRASVLLCPSEYVEPCAGVVAEAAMCGTPAVGSSWGGFSEAIVPGVTGCTAATLREWLDGVEAAVRLDRASCANYAREHYGLDSAVAQYRRVLAQLAALHEAGWYAGV